MLSRDIRFFFIGFLTCIFVIVIGLKIVLIREDRDIRKHVLDIPHTEEFTLSPTDELRRSVLQEGLPSDIYISQIKRYKVFFIDNEERLLFVDRTYRSDEPETFMGLLKFDENEGWKKYIEVPFPYTILDVWPEQIPGTANTALHLQIKNSDVGAGSGEGILMEVVQREHGWNVVRCMYHASDMGTQNEFTKDSKGVWFLNQVSKETGDNDSTPIDVCNTPPKVTIYN